MVILSIPGHGIFVFFRRQRRSLDRRGYGGVSQQHLGRGIDCLKGRLTSNAYGGIRQQFYHFAGSHPVTVCLNNL